MDVAICWRWGVVLSASLHSGHSLAVIGQCDKAPLGCCVGQATKAETREADSAFDDAEHGFDGLLAHVVSGSDIVGLQLGFHGDAPGFGDPPRGFRCGWRPEVVGAVRLGSADCDQGFDRVRLQRRDGVGAGVTGVGQDCLGQADCVPLAKDKGGKARRIGRRCDRFGREHQLRAIGADHGLGIVSLAEFVRRGGASGRCPGRSGCSAAQVAARCQAVWAGVRVGRFCCHKPPAS